MIYKMEGNCQMVEVEECAFDKHILVHIGDGFEEYGNVKYTSFINLELSRNKCEELIKCLQYALKDYDEKGE